MDDQIEFIELLYWKPRLEDILYCKDLYEPVEGDSVEPSNKTDKEWDVLHRKACSNISDSGLRKASFIMF